MDQRKLGKARAYERETEHAIAPAERPAFHLTPRIGWMNDPNGFSYYGGQYHLFYQYNPYDVVWDAMHWGHAVSRDLLHWTYLPCALAPDEEYDAFGVFSGSAAETADGQQLLMYTGVIRQPDGRLLQTQCVAVGDGLDYRKAAGNPVLDGADLPAGKSPYDFRDPKIWREADGSYRAVAVSCDRDRNGAVLLFASPDGFAWRFESVLAENDGSLGRMWECPDFFPLDGKHVLLVSPEEMLARGFEYASGNGTVCMIGDFDEGRKRFVPDSDRAVDHGIDFYAPQTLLAPDGRRILIGWMQNWAACKPTGYETRKWFGQMSLPRELSIREGRLYQQPVRELEGLRRDAVEARNLCFSGERTLAGVGGRQLELDLCLRPADPGDPYRRFTLRFAQGGAFHTDLTFRPRESLLEIDRRYSGTRRADVHRRETRVRQPDGELRLRVILDRFSVEVFVNGGEQVMSATVMTDPAASGVSFLADGRVAMDLTKYSLLTEA